MDETNRAKRVISFSPPDITEEEISAVGDALRSGWITTGPRTKRLEKELAAFTHAAGFACLSSATTSLECALRAIGIGPGDEVITSAYTYTASASPIVHVGAKPVLCDCEADGFGIDIDALPQLITDKTKAIIPVDLGGRMVDYDHLFDVLNQERDHWHPSNDIERCYDRIMVISDSAHSLGACYKGKPSGSVADFSTFSFHAVKNFTTAEGGGLAWRDAGFDNDAFYHQIMLLSLHGQDKDALAKNKPGAWEYDVKFPGWKCNMTEMQAALGLVQLKRYPSLLARRRDMVDHYQRRLADAPVTLVHHFDNVNQSSGHLMLTNVSGFDRQACNRVIIAMAEAGVATNVHYKPLPLLTAYHDLGFRVEDYPNAYARFSNEITLPLHTLLTDEDIDYICDCYIRAIASESASSAHHSC